MVSTDKWMNGLTFKQRRQVRATERQSGRKAARSLADSYRRQSSGSLGASAASFGYSRSAGGSPPSEKGMYEEMLLNPGTVPSVGRPDHVMFGSLKKKIAWETTITSGEASGAVSAVFHPGRFELITYEGLGDANTVQEIVAPSYDPAADYSSGRVVAASLSMRSDVQLAGSSDVTGKVIAVASSQLPAATDFTPALVRSSGLTALASYEGDAVRGAEVVLPPVGSQPPASFETTYTLRGSQSAIYHVSDSGTNLAAAGWTLAPADAANFVVFTDSEGAVANLAVIPDDYSGAVQFEILLNGSATAGTGEFTVIVTREIGGTTTTANYATANDTSAGKSALMIGLDRGDGIIKSITVQNNTGAAWTMSSGRESIVTMNFLESAPSGTEPALCLYAHGLANAQVMRVTCVAIVELMPSNDLSRALPDEASFGFFAEPDELTDLERRFEEIRWARPPQRDNGARAASFSSIFRRVARSPIVKSIAKRSLREFARMGQDFLEPKLG